MAKATAAMAAALYVVRTGTVHIEDADGTTVEYGPGGKVSLTKDELKELPEGVTVETVEERRQRLGADFIVPGERRSSPTFSPELFAGQASGGPAISDETANKLATAIDRLAGCVDGETGSRLASAIHRLADVLGAEPEAASADDASNAGERDKGDAGDTKSKATKAS